MSQLKQKPHFDNHIKRLRGYCTIKELVNTYYDWKFVKEHRTK